MVPDIVVNFAETTPLNIPMYPINTCNYSISPAEDSFTADGGAGSVNVSDPDFCGWTAVSNAEWITITSSASGTGAGTVDYLVTENTGIERTGTMDIAGETFTVEQAGVTTVDGPVPDIKANGSEGPFVISQGYPLFVTISLDAGTYSGKDADCWIYVISPSGTYWYTINTGWQSSNTPIRVYGGPLFNLPPTTILNMSTLPIGGYSFSFEIDDNMDNVKDGTYKDSVQVGIE